MPAYKLERDPFAEEWSDPFFFSTPALDRLAGDLRVALDRGHALLLDVAGSGKSTLTDRLADQAPDGWRLFRLRAGPAMDPKAFVQALLESLGLPPREPAAAALRDADTFLELLAERDVRPVLSIDEAERLDDDALGQLAYLARRWEVFGARFLVVAEPGVEPRLAAAGGGEGLPGAPARFEMPRFDTGQVGDYLHLRLFRAGLAGDSPFDAALVDRVAEASGGRVGAIGGVAGSLLGPDGSGVGGTGKGRGGRRRWPVALAVLAGLGVLLSMAIPGTSSSLGEARGRQTQGVFQSSIRPAARAGDPEARRGSAAADGPMP